MAHSLEELNTLHSRDVAAGDFLALTFAKAAAGHEGKAGAEGHLYRLRPHRAKAIVPALQVTDAPDSAGPQAYAEIVRRRSLLGRIPGARPAPALVRLNGLSADATASFITEGAPIPVSALAFGTPLLLQPGKVATIVPFSNELVKHGDPAAFALVQSDMTRALAAAIDGALLDGLAAVTGGRPASVLNGVSAIPGGSPSGIEDEITAMVTSVRGGDAEQPAFITSLSGALYLATLRDAGGDRIFPDVSLAGGTLLGAPVLVSPAAGTKLIFVDGALLLYSDGGVEIERSNASAFQLSDAPTDGAASVVSVWQVNSVAIRAIQYVSWRLALANGISYTELPLGSPVV